MIIHKDFAQSTGRQVCEKLKDLIPRHNFMIPVQAAIGGKIVAKSQLKALKDVLTKIHGGGATDRKRKLLEKQKGKARSKQFGKVEIPQEALLEY